MSIKVLFHLTIVKVSASSIPKSQHAILFFSQKLSLHSSDHNNPKTSSIKLILTQNRKTQETHGLSHNEARRFRLLSSSSSRSSFFSLKHTRDERRAAGTPLRGQVRWRSLVRTCDPIHDPHRKLTEKREIEDPNSSQRKIHFPQFHFHHSPSLLLITLSPLRKCLLPSNPTDFNPITGPISRTVLQSHPTRDPSIAAFSLLFGIESDWGKAK